MLLNPKKTQQNSGGRNTEEIDPFDSEEELVKHICKCHLDCVSWSKELNPIQNHQKVALSQS